MLYLKMALLNIMRRKQKSTLVVIISLIISFFLFVYVSAIQTNEQELSTLPEAIPVTAHVVNLNGTQVVGLEISSKILDAINNSGHIKDLYYSMQLAANFSNLPDEKEKYKEIRLQAVNDINAIPNYQDRDIQLGSSYSFDFLRGNDAMCIADDIWLQMNHLSFGDSIEIILYGLKYDPSNFTFTLVPLGTSSLQIVGSMSTAGSEGGAYMDLLCPVGWAKDKHKAAGVNVFCDSATFTVADPLNLDEFKAFMKEYYFSSVNPLNMANVYGSALSVHDETFIKTATRLKSHLETLYRFAAVVFFVIALVGYALSYLLMQSRRIEVVLMRSLGTSRKECVLIMFIEYAILGCLGSLFGLLVSVLCMGYSGAGPILAFLMFFVSFVLGIAGSAYQLSQWTAMSGLVKAET